MIEDDDLMIMMEIYRKNKVLKENRFLRKLKHSVPVRKRMNEPRISITFRVITI